MPIERSGGETPKKVVVAVCRTSVSLAVFEVLGWAVAKTTQPSTSAAMLSTETTLKRLTDILPLNPLNPAFYASV
jgi:hypothetical protein